MRVLVTGGGGFLGGAIVRRLCLAGETVRSFSRGTYSMLRAAGVECRQGDLADGEAVAEAVRGCDVVFHVGARAGVWGNYQDFYRANVVGTLNVIQACRRHGTARLVYTSSPSVVFAGRDMEGADERAPYARRFLAAYPATKALAEQAVLAANGADLATVALRPHLIWGPGDTHILPGLAARARAGRLRRIGSGEHRVDFTYIDNAAEAHLLAAARLEPGSPVAGRAFFVTQDEPVLLWEFIDRLLAAVGAPRSGPPVPLALARAAAWLCEGAWRWLPLGGEPPLTRFLVEELSTSHWFDISAAREKLGYRPLVSVEEGLGRLQEWWRQRQAQSL